MPSTDRIKIGTAADAIHTTRAIPYEDAILSVETLPSPPIAASPCILITLKASSVKLSIHRGEDGVSLSMPAAYYFITLHKREDVQVRTGDGDDTLELSAENDSVIAIQTGAGNDVIHGHTGTNGNIVVDAGAGNDYMEVSGSGIATLYGGSGNDVMQANTSQASLFAGEGDDILESHGASIISAPSGRNRITCKMGGDQVYSNADSQIIAISGGVALPTAGAHAGYQAISIDGDITYHNRVSDLLALLATTKAGNSLLTSLDASGAQITIREIGSLDNAYYEPDDIHLDPSVRGIDQAGNRQLAGSIGFNPLTQKPNTPAAVILFHELCHAWNYANGTVLPDHENQVTGLPTADSFDFDGDPNTPPTNTNPDPFNENALRHELGLPRRNTY
ncbi:hypothetical protein JYG34_18505 [Pseudomonas entomophila]|uniref:M91 family zinc metallopeptidase n=1 Tax=Pseudomonas entomophila TaxID=312306 RepID=UPI001BCB2239|nr:M91 family zinc metallopeptidase [Pseudomonas entomophila]QVM89991.1 hypothetical protein JYG34_18505 [Pseudomonas entomophila]